MTRISITRRALFGASLALATSLMLLAAPAFAQTAPTPASAGAPDDKTIQDIIVTGSAIKTSPDQIAVPVSIVNAEAISKAGMSTNVLEILRKQLPAFAGRSNTGNSTPPTPTRTPPGDRRSSSAISTR